MKVLLFWSGLLALWTAIQLIFAPHLITVLLLGGAAVAVALTAFVARLARPADDRPAGLSASTPLLAFGVAALLSGTELGPWCLALGGLMTAAGLAGLMGER